MDLSTHLELAESVVRQLIGTYFETFNSPAELHKRGIAPRKVPPEYMKMADMFRRVRTRDIAPELVDRTSLYAQLSTVGSMFVDDHELRLCIGSGATIDPALKLSAGQLLGSAHVAMQYLVYTYPELSTLSLRITTELELQLWDSRFQTAFGRICVSVQ